jgi:hypothetical protein
VAYHDKSRLEQDSSYRSVLPNRTTAYHILFVDSLLWAIE